MTQTFWRVWPDRDGVRVARDLENSLPPGPALQPQHLEELDGRVVWVDHTQGAEIPTITLAAFVAWLEQRGQRAWLTW